MQESFALKICIQGLIINKNKRSSKTFLNIYCV